MIFVQSNLFTLHNQINKSLETDLTKKSELYSFLDTVTYFFFIWMPRPVQVKLPAIDLIYSYNRKTPL